jgi:hypothetical protein
VSNARTLRHFFKFICTIILLMSLISCENFFVDPVLKTITVTPPTPSFVQGAVQQFTAIGTYDNGTTKVLGECNWSTSNTGVMFINQSGIGTATGQGSATITATQDVGVGTTTVTVNSSPLVSLAISPVNSTISVGTSTAQQYFATATFSDGSTKDVSGTVNWSSSNTSVATISSTGQANAIAVGTTTIKAISGTISDSTSLTVLR